MTGSVEEADAERLSRVLDSVYGENAGERDARDVALMVGWARQFCLERRIGG
ncbi:hypothetical protein HDU76_005947 [Blyttiomyces sp. JEL0837]|nr:hypothetical protein HDU76_005947 [Blyttiomyces sp. JEL0837]